MNEECSKGAFELIQPWVTWTLVVVGWAIVNVAAALRERRKEDAALVDDLEARVEDIREAAEEYYTAPVAGSGAQAALVRFKVKSFGNRLEVLRKRRHGAYDLSSEFIALRKALTGGDFDSVNRAQRSRDDLVVQKVWSVSDDFINALHLEFEAANPLRLLVFW